MQVESLNVKLFALDSMLERLQPRQKREAGVTANVILSLIDRMKGDASPLSRRYSQFQAFAYNTHGLIAFDEGTKESARRAVAHFEKYLEVHETMGYDEGIASIKSNIAYAKSMYEGDNNNEELLTASQEMYELRTAELGEEQDQTIIAGKNYAIDLHNANRGDDARELLMKLQATSKRVRGSEHNITKEVALALEELEVADHG